ncbi:hypothetical protein DL767_000916 [Monosporascus sp. MG133]|nr:hypothetical protein DL767_000916 [Monosporascus sp. MG133]
MALTEISPALLAMCAGLIVLSAFIASPFLSWSRKIPGPFVAKYTSLWYAWQQYRDDFHWTNIKLHRQKGKIVQIMPGYFSIDDPASHKTIYSYTAPWIKGEFYIAWNVGPNPSLTNLFAARDPILHSSMRRKVASMYSMSSLVSYEPYVDHCIDLFHSQLENLASTRSTVNLGRWLQYFAFDAVSMITFGERLGFLDHGKDVENLIQNLDHDHAVLNLLGTYPGLIGAYKKLSGLFTGTKVMFFQRFVTDKIETSRREKQDLPDHGPVYMVKKFINAQRKDDKKWMTDWDIVANAGSNIGAGSDTTAIALSTIVYYMYRDPQILQRVRMEVDSASLPARPNLHEVQKLPYLQAVIKESLRVQPAAGVPLWREVPKGGAVVSGQFFPEGTNLGVSSWVAHHNQDIYGLDADEFRPSRWLEAAGTQATAMEQNLVPFGLGSRTCIGKNVSLLEINKLIPVLVRDFDFSFLDKTGAPETRDYVTVTNDWFVKMPHLYARVVRRGNTAA